jgi:hypothetical protein
MEMNVKTGVFLGVLIGVAVTSAVLFSYVGYEPKNYDDCLLQNIRNVHTQLGEAQITLACRDKFSAKKKPKGRKLSPAELEMLIGSSGLGYTSDYYSGRIYNGNYSLKITKVFIQLTINEQDRQIQRVYVDDNLSIAPLQVGNFGFPILSGSKNAHYEWQISGAEGVAL